MERKTVLVIEDSPYLAESVQDMLDIKGYQAIIAQNGREAIELSLKHHPDLILLDIRLPDIDGYEVYRRIREDEWGKRAKVLVLTASESIENISRNINLPTDYILFKPEWSMAALLERIREVTEDR